MEADLLSVLAYLAWVSSRLRADLDSDSLCARIVTHYVYCTPKSNAEKRVLGTNRTGFVFSCL